VDLEPLGKPVLPVADRAWPDFVKVLWNAWRQDPVTSQYGPADLAAVRELARQYVELAPNEQRLRMDGLGLTPKGKRDLRWRISEVEVVSSRPQLAEVRRLRAVESA
jgi:hypothetical protein